MNRVERNFYAAITEGKARSRRTIRKYTTGAERSSIKAWIRAMNAPAEPEEEISVPVLAQDE